MDTGAFQLRNDTSLVPHIAGKPAEIMDDDELDGVLLGRAEGQHSLKSGTLRGLCRLSFVFVAKNLEDRPTVTSAELNASGLLGSETQGLHLLFCGDAAVDNGIHVALARLQRRIPQIVRECASLI